MPICRLSRTTWRLGHDGTVVADGVAALSTNSRPARYGNLYFDLQCLLAILPMCQDCLGKTLRNRNEGGRIMRKNVLIIGVCAAGRPQGRGAEEESGEDQAAARLPYRALCDRARRASHGGRPARYRHVRRHAEGASLCGDRSL